MTTNSVRAVAWSIASRSTAPWSRTHLTRDGRRTVCGYRIPRTTKHPDPPLTDECKRCRAMLAKETKDGQES